VAIAQSREGAMAGGNRCIGWASTEKISCSGSRSNFNAQRRRDMETCR
jgi:hypothetical protein